MNTLSLPDKKTCVRLLAMLALAPALAGMLLFVTALIPAERVQTQLHTAEAAHFLDDSYPEYLGFREIDMYTECVGLGIAAQMTFSAENLAAMRTWGECPGLRQAVQDNFQRAGTPYARYIHGYQVLLRPLYAFLSFQEVRLFLALGGLVLLLGLYAAARRRLNETYALALTGSFLFAGTLHVFMLATHAAQFWLVLTGCIAALLTRTRVPVLLFCALGLADAFLSFLSMGSLSLSLPLLCFCLGAWFEGRDTKDTLMSAFCCCTAWGLGLLSLWLLKWGLAQVLLPPNPQMLDAVNYYTARNVLMILTALGNNLYNSLWWVWLPLFAWLGCRFRTQGLHIPQGLTIVLFPALIPLIWMCLIPGQSGVKHASFVSIIVWPILAACFLLLLAAPREAPSLHSATKTE